MAWLSQRAYAKHRNCRLSAVQRAIRDGRLSKSLGRNGDGPWQITDAALADAEWAATTKDNRVPLGVQMQREGLNVPAAPNPPPPVDPGEEGGVPSRTISLARREAAEAELAEIELAEKRLELIPAKDVEARLVNEHTRARTKLMGVPSRARQQDPTLTPDHLTLFEDLIREALEDLAEEDEAESVPEGAAS